jgi:tetratricopeptide (TPR) repeat protein
MKILNLSWIVFSALCAIAMQAQEPAQPRPATATSVALREAASLSMETPAQQRIAVAKRQIAASPGKVNAYNDLAVAYLRRARETDDSDYLLAAGQTIAQGLKLDSANFQLQKTQIALMLALHQFSEARDKATALNHRTPDDVMIYGYIAEADIALGDYAGAEKSTQWMLNMLPNNVSGLMLGAKLRVLYGDSEGALDFLRLAYTETSPTEAEDLAWIANQIASVQIDSGQVEAAAALLEHTQQLFPNYPCTLENLGKARLDQHRAGDALALLREARKLDSNAHVLYELALAEATAGETAASDRDYAEFEALAVHPGNLFDDSQRDLIYWYAGHPSTAPKALILARQQIALRHDVWTMDAYAWALFVNGDFSEADAQEQKAIAVGVQSAQIFDHAGHIALKLDRKEDAGKYFELAIRANSSSQYAADARQSVGISTADAAKITSGIASSSSPRPATETIATSGSAEVSKALTTPVSSTASTGSSPVVAFAPVPARLLTPQPTDTDRMIRRAQGLVSHDPKDATGYSALGAAHFQRARETGDVSDYQLAEESLARSLDLVSTDFSADEPLGTMAEVCMGEHRFADALTFAQRALALGSGDVSSFAIVGDAYADMGEYDKAAQAYARLTPRDMTLSPRASYARDSRISYLKFVAGDTPGAIALMKVAVAEGTEAQLPSENLAWLYYELGEYYVQAGDAASADIAYVTALTVHPGDYRALASLGRLRANIGRSAEAIVLYRSAIAVVPMPTFVAELGDLYTKSGNPTEARKQYQLVEYIGLLGHISQVLHNRDLAVFYADHDIKLADALELAQRELEVRHDVYTWDALAWALYKNGKIEEAANASHKALQFRTRDSLLLFHAGMIAEREGQHEQAKHELSEALQINPHFHLVFAQEAQRQLVLLDSQLASGENHAR